MTILQQLITVPSVDPDDARRRRLLNIVLVTFATLAVVGLAVSLLRTRALTIASSDELFAFYGYLAFLVIAAGLYVVNRNWSGTAASLSLVMLLSILLAFVDDPAQIADGRSLVVFAIPVVLASVLLPAYLSFFVAALCSGVITLVALSVPGVIPNTFAMVVYFAIAVVSWLSGRGLEQALRDVRSLNNELEKRVQDRTRDLREALTREQTEARKNQAILQSIADGVIVFDELGRANVANPAVNGLLERPPSRILGATIDELMESVTPENQAEVKSLFNVSTNQPAPLNVEWGDRTLSLSVAPLVADQPGVGGSVVVFRDVSREAEISRMKSIIVAMVSHELRTPLNAVQGLAEILQQGVYGQLAEKQQQTIDRIILNTKRLMSLVRDLLDQAQIEAGTLKIESVIFSPSELLDSVREVVTGMARQKNLQFQLSISDNLPAALVGDPQRLGQILINLSTNAIKFTETGSVKVSLDLQDSAHWTMAVADTGPGIPISAEAYIFDAFRQIDSSAGRRHGGIGLGLSIVKRLVNVMEGDIKLSSRIGRGSTFTVILPLIHPSPHTINS